MGYLKRPVSSEGSPVPDRDWVDPEFVSRWPALGEYLSASTWDDGAPRQPCTLLIFSEHGVVKACLNDKEAGRVAFLTNASFLGLLDGLEEGLVRGVLDWRGRRADPPGRRSGK